MVMPNRHDGASSPEWWDDLPPEVKRRISPPAPDPSAGSVPDRVPDPAANRGVDRAESDRPAFRPAVVGDLSRLALLFLVVVLGNVLFLLIALSFVFNRATGAT